MFTTLNNEIAKRILNYALDGKYRFCAYGLYNHHNLTFNDITFERLYLYVYDFLGDHFDRMITDDSIDLCVRSFIYRFHSQRLGRGKTYSFKL